MSSVHLLVNAAARRGSGDGAKVAEQLRSLGHDPVLVGASNAAEVEPLLRELRPAIERLIVVGGDGIIHHALGALAETQLPVGLVPSGTGNDFARSLGLPRRRRAAVEAALGPAEPIDLLRVRLGGDDGGAVTERWVASVLTAGFSGRVNGTANGLSFPRGQQKYTVATLMEARRLQTFELSGTVDDGVLRSQCTFFAVGNTRHFGGGMAICPDADPTDGRLDLTVVDAVSRASLLLMLPTVFAGRHVRHHAVRQMSGRSATLVLDEDLWADGEPLGRGPATIECVPGALLVAGVASA